MITSYSFHTVTCNFIQTIKWTWPNWKELSTTDTRLWKYVHLLESSDTWPTRFFKCLGHTGGSLVTSYQISSN